MAGRPAGSSSGRGTTLAGTIGLYPAGRAFIPVFAGVTGLIAVAVLAEGVRLLVSGDLSGLVPAVLASLALTALIAGVRAASVRWPERQAGKLVRAVNELLGSAAGCVGRPADSSCA